MRRTIAVIPAVALVIASVALWFAGIALHESGPVRGERAERAAFAAAVQQGQRPNIAARNIAGVLRQELEAQQVAATERQRVSQWLLLAAALTTVGVVVSLGANLRVRPGPLSTSAA